MSKKHFIALADFLREHNALADSSANVSHFASSHLKTLADFCKNQNPRFDRDRWLGYIAGTNGPNGGAR